MTNFDRAAEIIADAFRPGLLTADGLGRDIARLLNDAGLLAPDTTTRPARQAPEEA